MIPKPKFSQRSRASFAIMDMERDPSLTASAACEGARIALSSFLALLKRPKHADLTERYDAVKRARGAKGYTATIRSDTVENLLRRERIDNDIDWARWRK